MSELTVPFVDMVNAPRIGTVLVVDGGDPQVRDQNLTNFNYDEIVLIGYKGIVDALAPRFVRRRLGSLAPRFTNCSFDNLKCRWLDLGRAQFVNCSFRNVNVKVASPINAVFIDCYFSGTWEGNFRPTDAFGPHKSEQSFRGNDLRELKGADFQGGIDYRANALLRHDGSQILVTTTTEWLPKAVQMAANDPFTHNRLTSLLGQGPFYIGQDWMLLERDETDPEVWASFLALDQPS